MTGEDREAIRRLVDEAPPLSQEQRALIRRALDGRDTR